MVGGGAVHFTSNYWRFHPEDFHERSLVGAVPGADLRDWPIAYDELEPYYTRAEWDLGSSGLCDSNPFHRTSSKRSPLSALPLNLSRPMIGRAAKQLCAQSNRDPTGSLCQAQRG